MVADGGRPARHRGRDRRSGSDAPARPAAGVRRDGGGRTAPCTCGCASLGHTSNRACYIKAESEGRITFTSHAAT
ncbi:MAG: hypothetical protein DME14_16325 [Candidatus Rokuibacteriota bacterium]|nr:MAG: hypothetical protein DME14_16325 [Candidatus Rokubacteria bacterium]